MGGIIALPMAPSDNFGDTQKNRYYLKNPSMHLKDLLYLVIGLYVRERHPLIRESKSERHDHSYHFEIILELKIE